MAKGIAHREWVIDRNDYRDENGRLDENAFRAAVQTELAMTEYIMERFGVAIIVAPVSRQAGNGVWYREAYIFKSATVPSAGAQKPEPEDALDLTSDGEVIDFDALAEVE